MKKYNSFNVRSCSAHNESLIPLALSFLFSFFLFSSALWVLVCVVKFSFNKIDLKSFYSYFKEKSGNLVQFQTHLLIECLLAHGFWMAIIVIFTFHVFAILRKLFCVFLSVFFLFLTVILNISIFIIILLEIFWQATCILHKLMLLYFVRDGASRIFFFSIYMDVNWKKKKQQYIQQYCHGNREAKREPNTNLINELFLIISTWPNDYHRSGRHFWLPYILLRLFACFSSCAHCSYYYLFNRKRIYIFGAPMQKQRSR